MPFKVILLSGIFFTCQGLEPIGDPAHNWQSSLPAAPSYGNYATPLQNDNVSHKSQIIQPTVYSTLTTQKQETRTHYLISTNNEQNYHTGRLEEPTTPISNSEKVHLGNWGFKMESIEDNDNYPKGQNIINKIQYPKLRNTTSYAAWIQNYNDSQIFPIYPTQKQAFRNQGSLMQQVIISELKKPRGPPQNLFYMDTNYFPLSKKTNFTNHTIQFEPRPLTEGELVNENNWGLYIEPIKAERNNHSIQNMRSLFHGLPAIAQGNTRVSSENKDSSKTHLLQWHVGIYSKAFAPFMQICGGTLVTTKAVISAAHCFWSDLDGAQPASRFAVAAGKLYRPWNDNHDFFAQKSELSLQVPKLLLRNYNSLSGLYHSRVSEVHLPVRFRGGFTSFQDDIAVVLLTSEFTPSPAVRPVCVVFDEDLEQMQLQSGNEGIVLGWGLTAENGPPAQALLYLHMPYVPIEECIVTADPSFLKYITSDKICAGVTTGKALCRGDSGGGLVFFDETTGDRVPLLLGVASTAPRNDNLCNTHARATLTRVLAHSAFLRLHVPDIEEACSNNYVNFRPPLRQGFLADRLADQDNTETQAATTKSNINFVCNCYCNNSTKP